MDNSKFFWGIIVFLVGGLMLAANFGYLPENFWNELWKFWPVLLILWGISALFARKERNNNRFALIISIILILIILSAVIWQFGGHESKQINRLNVSETELRDNVNMNVKFGAAELNMAASESGTLSGVIESSTDATITRKNYNDTTEITLDQNYSNPNFWIGKGNKNKLDIELPQKPAYGIHLDTGASKFNLDFTKVILNQLIINGGACSGEIKVGKSQDLAKLQISSGASSFDIKIPQGIALKINDNSGLSSLNYDNIPLNKNGKEYKTADYDSAIKRIEVQLSTGASSVNIEEF